MEVSDTRFCSYIHIILAVLMVNTLTLYALLIIQLFFLLPIINWVGILVCFLPCHAYVASGWIDNYLVSINQSGLLLCT